MARPPNKGGPDGGSAAVIALREPSGGGAGTTFKPLRGYRGTVDTKTETTALPRKLGCFEFLTALPRKPGFLLILAALPR